MIIEFCQNLLNIVFYMVKIKRCYLSIFVKIISDMSKLLNAQLYLCIFKSCKKVKPVLPNNAC